MADDFYRAKKAIWNDVIPAKVKGHDVELYIQDINEPHSSTGVYSLYNDKWVTKPIKEMVAIDTNNVELKSGKIMQQIEELEEDSATSSSDIEALIEEIKNMRKAGLEENGEFSTENLVFKVLRHTGYLKRLYDLKHSIKGKELSLENVSLEEGLFDSKWFKGSALALGIMINILIFGSMTDKGVLDLKVGKERVEKIANYINSLDSEDFSELAEKVSAIPRNKIDQFKNKYLGDF